MSKGHGRYWSIIWFTLGCPVLIAAVVVWSWIGVITVTLIALLFTSVILGSAPNQSDDPHTVFGGIPWRVVAGPALRWAVVAVAIVLTTVFSPWLGVLALLAVIGTSPWATRRLARSRSQPEDDMDHIRDLVRQMDLPGLCWAWRASHDLLDRIQDVEGRGRLVTLRQAYLDEMEHRDALGFAEWLEVAQGATDPEVFLNDRPGGAAAA